MLLRLSPGARLAPCALALALATALTTVTTTRAAAQGNILEPAVQLAGIEKLASASAADTAQLGQAQQKPSASSSRIFYGALLAGAALSFQYSVDPDEGGYEDGWSTAAAFPDKAVHALAGWALTGVGIDLGARPWVAAASVCAAGAAFELSQGYVSRIDIAADCVGAAGAALWRNWRDRVDARRGR